MADESEFTSDLIATGATGYARAAAQLLLERRPGLEGQFGPSAFQAWSRHLAQTSRELAAAILVSEPDLFVEDVVWARAGFEFREVPVDSLQAGLECLRDALEQELPEHARELPRRYVSASLERLKEPAPDAGSAFGGDAPLDRLALEYLEAVLSGKPRRAMDLVLGAAEDGLETSDAFACLSMAQTHVGELWHSHQVSIAQEHLVTSTTEATMTLLAGRSSPSRREDRTVVVAPVSGNAHELGARAMAHHFEIAGWNAIHLGSELPAAALAEALQIFGARMLALSVTLSTQLSDSVRTVAAARSAQPSVKVLVGGRVFARLPELWRKIGADGSATDPAQALATAERLLSS